MQLHARREVLPLLLALTSLSATGCHSQTTPSPQQQQVAAIASENPAVSAQLHEIAAAGKLSDLHWPDFSDYRMHFQHIYEASGSSPVWAPVWLVNGQPTPQALGVIQALENSKLKGLNPDDYDAARWNDRLNALKSAPSADTQARFDAALTVSAMRYISDLHIGRVNPKHFDFGIDIEQNKYNLPQFVTTQVIHASDVTAVLNSVELQYQGYKRTEAALGQYLQLAAKGDGPAVPDAAKPPAPGAEYAGAPQLAQRLQLLGDLPASSAIDPNANTYSDELATAVKHFQTRHGLTPDGKLTKDTLRELNTPLATRVRQLQDALERWRWVPRQFAEPPIVVNVPEFSVRAFETRPNDPNLHVALQMNVVVGKALRSQTPVFTKQMKYIVFRPYWNVPYSILKAEVIPSITKNRNYIANKNFEVTDNSGKVITDGAVSDAVLAGLRAGKYSVRQKPGPTNSLGLVKFLFPNEYDVYLHSTPAQQLFGQSRRDFSHGCIRVEKPAELAAFILRNQPQRNGQPWTLDTIKAAMQSGPDNQQINLATPVPVLIMYITAEVEEDGSVHFFNDIYGHDKTLEAVLAKGQPYPG